MPLDEILRLKRKELKREKKQRPLSGLRRAAEKGGQPRSFADALRSNGNVRIIGEVKKASPSKGVIKENFDHVAIAKEYEAAGVGALSVLTEKSKFEGNLRFLKEIRKAVNLPILRKDFLLDEYHIWQARAAGADAVLLIVAILEDDELKALNELAARLGMDAIIEVHNEEEMERALHIEPRILGVNNRDLSTFETHLDTTSKLKEIFDAHELSRKDCVFVSESGIHNSDHMRLLKKLRVDAALIGESFMRADSIAEKMNEFRQKSDHQLRNESMRSLTRFQSSDEIERRGDERPRQNMRRRAHGGRAGGV